RSEFAPASHTSQAFQNGPGSYRVAPNMRGWLVNERVRTWLLALGCYSLLLATYALVAGPARLTDHTPYNHFALQAEAWLRGRLDLGGTPPDYAGSNDFALYADKWYVPFPAFPALLLVPLV